MIPGPGELGLLDDWSRRDLDRLGKVMAMMAGACAFSAGLVILVGNFPRAAIDLLTEEPFGFFIGIFGLGAFCLCRLASKGVFGAWEFGLALGLLYGVQDNAQSVNATQSVLALLAACFLGADGLGSAAEALSSTRQDPPTSMTLND